MDLATREQLVKGAGVWMHSALVYYIVTPGVGVGGSSGRDEPAGKQDWCRDVRLMEGAR
jgi:hypothetical protein